MENRLDAELEFHWERQVADKMREGLTEEEARRRVRLEFGGMEQVKEECRDARGTRWAENVLQDARYAGRTLRKSPGFTVAAVLTLALGIGANTAVFTIVNGVLLRPLPFAQSERLVALSYLPRNNAFIMATEGMSDRDYLEYQRGQHALENVATYGAFAMTLTGQGSPTRVAGAEVTPDLFRVLRVTTAAGQAFSNHEERVALLSDQLWHSRFGADPQVVGKTAKLDGNVRTIVGVMPAGFGFPDNTEVWTPLTVRSSPNRSIIRKVIGRLKPGTSVEQAKAELGSLLRRSPRGPGEDASDFVSSAMPLKDAIAGKTRTSLVIFLGAVGFVLLIACANVGNLLLIRATSRRQEIAVRAALGASRGRLVRQLLTESLLLAMMGGAFAVLLAWLSVPALLSVAPAGLIPRLNDIHLDGWVLAFTVGVSALVGIVFGLAPAMGATRGGRASLGGLGRTVTGGHRGVRNAFVVAEIALALILLAGAGLMLKSFARMRAVDPGFRPGNVLTMTVDLPDSTYQTAAQMQVFHQRALERLARIPGVTAWGAVNWLPLGGPSVRGDFQLEGGRKLPQGYLVVKPVVDPGYFRTIGIRLLNGRDFTGRDDGSNPGVTIVSRAVAHDLWPGQNVLGKRISMEDQPGEGDWLTIVGVVDDVRQKSLTARPEPAVYQPYAQVAHTFFLSHMTFAVRTLTDPVAVAPALRRALREVDRDQPVEIATMDDVIAATMRTTRFQTSLLAAFALMALALAAVGIYGVLAYAVFERTHEIGIRMALGANAGNVLAMVMRNSLALTAAGLAIGSAGALAVTRVLIRFLFEVKPSDPATFAAVAILLAAIALLASWIPAKRATRVDPLTALRFE
jgi:predicted permease